MADEAVKVRVDKWLWAARFFKTRALASTAAQGGKIQLGGQRIKPSRALAVGDQLSIQKGNETYIVRVTRLSERRGPASVAQTLYEELPDSILARDLAREERQVQWAAQPEPHGRPDKRSRRQWRKLTGR